MKHDPLALIPLLGSSRKTERGAKRFPAWFAVRAAPFALLALSASGADLAQTLRTLVENYPLAPHSEIGVHVVEMKTGKVLYGHDENLFFMPASNMKLITTRLALLKLGADYQFETRLIEEPSGDVTLVGSGDPSMSGRQYPYRHGVPAGPPLASIEELARQAFAAGLTHVRGYIVGDDRLYPWAPYPANWSQSDAAGENGAPVSALTVADNLINVAFSPGPKPGDLAKLSVTPAVEYFAIDNRIVTVPGAGEPQITMTRVPGSRQLLFAGTIPAESAFRSATVALDDPALYAACALYDALTRRGVSIDGHPVARHRSASDIYKAPEGKTLALRDSPPAAQLIQMADKVSENLHAELLLREVAKVERRSPTVENGVAVLNAFLAQIGAGADESRIDDGSGLSRNAQLTPRLVTRLLTYMYNSNVRDTWISMLPIGATDGTLSGRMCCSLDSHLIHAKTGTLNRSIALSGYTDSKTRGWIAFSILVNDFAAPASEIHAWVDKIALALTE